MSDADQALLLGGENWAAVQGAGLAPAGEIIAGRVHKAQLDLYDHNLRPLELSRGKLLAKDGPTSVDSVAMTQLDRQMNELQALDVRLDVMMREALALEVRHGLTMLDALPTAAHDDFSESTLLPADALLYSLSPDPRDPQREQQNQKLTSELSAIATSAAELGARVDALPLQVTTELSDQTAEPDCQAGDNAPPPPDVVLD